MGISNAAKEEREALARSEAWFEERGGKGIPMEEVLAEQRESVATQIATGFAQAKRGELMDGGAAIERLHQRRAARLKSRE